MLSVLNDRELRNVRGESAVESPIGPEEPAEELDVAWMSGAMGSEFAMAFSFQRGVNLLLVRSASRKWVPIYGQLVGKSPASAVSSCESWANSVAA
jgi:hypothetical protein